MRTALLCPLALLALLVPTKPAAADSGTIIVLGDLPESFSRDRFIVRDQLGRVIGRIEPDRSGHGFTSFDAFGRINGSAETNPFRHFDRRSVITNQHGKRFRFGHSSFDRFDRFDFDRRFGLHGGFDRHDRFDKHDRFDRHHGLGKHRGFSKNKSFKPRRAERSWPLSNRRPR